ncbi:hypothetical protein [Nitrosopumilus maritimus]|uniref:Uncharacterized protein n=1 Tax=Nitrosopumilus maritimus (strain SCM1) TaxID=436308 RepID=A9A2L2_NITMS|nr:hypothetical protein [Nitrosopumilus maritimus]ABX13251.1 hypothetical protein Nmar_1355 [Nitrosopumilus maritimus SCM1]
MNKTVPIGIGIVVVAIIVGIFYLAPNLFVVTTMDVPEDLLHVQIDGKIKPYETPLNAPQSDRKPEYVLIPNKIYSELHGAIQIALYNVGTLPENLQHVQVSGFYDPEAPDWYYPEQDRTKQVIFVNDIVELEPVDLGNKYTTQELRDRYDQIHKEFELLKEEFSSGNMPQENYLSALQSLAEHEVELFLDVKEHTFERDEMTEYNFWHRGVMKFPTTLEQEVTKLTVN